VAAPQGVAAATVRLSVEGSFAVPTGRLGAETFVIPGTGSGFLIDPSGLLITNNHVVTGAAIVQVMVPGIDEPVPGFVVAASECADLALVQLQGDGYPSIGFASDIPPIGAEVYASGYPGGVEEVVVSLGTLVSENVDGSTPWSSLPRVLEHDALSGPGGSGGPLVLKSGSVIGVVYAGGGQPVRGYAIALDDVLSVITQLRTGVNVDWIGINGTAFSVDDGDLPVTSGIWVTSVESGSPADITGVNPGDIVTALEDIPVGSDGTMKAYCDILRSNQPGKPMRIEVIRPEESAILTGQVGGSALVFDRSIKELERPVGETASGAPLSGDWRDIWDQTGSLVAAIPSGWQWSSDSPTSDDPFLLAGPNLLGIEVGLFGDALEVRGTGIAVVAYPTEQPFRATDADIDDMGAEFLDSLEFAAQCRPAGSVGIPVNRTSAVNWPIVRSYRCDDDSTLVIAVGIIQAPITGQVRATLFAYAFAKTGADLSIVLSSIGSIDYFPK